MQRRSIKAWKDACVNPPYSSFQAQYDWCRFHPRSLMWYAQILSFWKVIRKIIHLFLYLPSFSVFNRTHWGFKLAFEPSVLHSSALVQNICQWQLKKVVLYFFCLVSLQCEENTSLADCSRYLKQPFSKPNLPSNNQTLKGTKESFWITSFLCSTKLTQNGKQDSGIDIWVACLLNCFWSPHFYRF